MRILLIRGCAMCAVLAVFVAEARAQVRQQIFVGAGVTVPRNEGTPSTAVSGGYALILPLDDGWSLRPLLGVSRVDPTTGGRESFPAVLAGALVIRRVTPTFSLLAGGGVNTLFPPRTSSRRHAVAIVSTNSGSTGAGSC